MWQHPTRTLHNASPASSLWCAPCTLLLCSVGEEYRRLHHEGMAALGIDTSQLASQALQMTYSRVQKSIMLVVYELVSVRLPGGQGAVAMGVPGVCL